MLRIERAHVMGMGSNNGMDRSVRSEFLMLLPAPFARPVTPVVRRKDHYLLNATGWRTLKLILFFDSRRCTYGDCYCFF